MKRHGQSRRVNDRVTVSLLPGDHSDLRALLLTDIHLNRVRSFDEGFLAIRTKIPELVARERPNAIITLGDLIQIGTPLPDEKMQRLLEFFDGLGVPTYCLPGNHDRGVYRHIDTAGFAFTHVIGDLALRLQHANLGAGSLWLSHDLGNYFRLRGLHVRPWLEMLRDTFADAIPREDVLVCGHCHQKTVHMDINCVTVAPFSPDLGVFGYAMLTVDTGFTIRHGEF